MLPRLLVGEGIVEIPGIATRALAALKGIPAAVVAEPDSKRTISLIVPQAALERSARLLHSEFFQQPDPALFAESPQPTATASYTRARKVEKRADWRKEQAQRLVLLRQN